MTDRTVRVRLEADISDFVTDIGVKAVAAVKRLEAAATSADKRLSTVGATAKLDDIGSKADTAGVKLEKAGARGETAAKKISAATDKASVSLNKAATAAGEVDKATSKVAASTEKATKLTDSHASALGRLRVAQLRLTEAQNRKGSDGTSSLAAAEEGVKAAERAVKKFEKAGNDSGKSFTTGLRKWLNDSGKSFTTGLRKWLTGSGGAADVGKAGGTVFGSGFLGVLKTPILGPAVVAILSAAILIAMPAVGAVAGGALVTGFGAGLVGLGLVFAAKSDAVKAKWKATLGQLGADMRLLAKPFESTLINIAGYFERTVNNFNPALAKAFSRLAGPVDQFASDFGRALEKLIPAIAPITTAFTAVLGSLGPALSSVMSDISAGMIKLSESISRNPQALADLVSGFGGLIRTTLDFITTLNNINGAFEKLTGGVSLVSVTMGILSGAVAAVAAPFELLSGALDGVNALLGKTGKDSATAGSSMADAANKTVALARANSGLGAAAKGTAPPVKTLAEQVAETKKKIADAKAATDTWINSLFVLQGLALSLSGAQISYQAAIDAVTASIKENGRTHDINTAKGRANKTALDDVAKAANAQTEAILRSNKGNAAAGRSAEASRANFVKLATQMGYTVPQAKRMAAAMVAIPNVLRTAKLEADKKDLDKKLAAARAALADPKLTARKRAKLEAEIRQLLAAKAQAQAAINSLSGKTVELRINTYKSLVETTTHRDVGVRVPAPPVKADGGFHPGGYPSYANGKLPDQATVAPGKGGGLVQWAEGSTGGEAFIPLAPSKRDRSTKILGKVADNFGLSLVKSFADGGFLPGGKLVDIAFLLKQLGIPFNPSAGVNYGNTLAAQNAANSQVGGARTASVKAARTETTAKADVARIQRAITLQQRYITQQRQGGASDKKMKAEQKELIGLQDQLYRAKRKVTSATTASSKADAVYKAKLDAATKATEAHKAAVEKLVAQQQAAVDMAAQISDSLTGSANIGDLFQDSLTGKGLLADLQGKGGDLKKFGGQIANLRKQGLSEDLIQQLIGKGAEQGGEVAQAILDGGIGLVTALNKAQKALDDQANLIGAGSAVKKYGQAISGARADGGPVKAGRLYRVNERGEETFRPDVNGQILPHNYLRSGGGTTTVEHHYHQTIQNTGISMAEADLIGRRALGALRLMGRR